MTQDRSQSGWHGQGYSLGGADIPVRLRSRRAFTFTEVMFAVILLGIGFIMLAGMFPVAIQQTQTTVEESMASTIVQTATRAMEQTLRDADVPATTNGAAAGMFLRLTQRFNPSTGLPYYDN